MVSPLDAKAKELAASCIIDARVLETSDVFQGPLTAITTLREAADLITAQAERIAAAEAEVRTLREALEKAERQRNGFFNAWKESRGGCDA